MTDDEKDAKIVHLQDEVIRLRALILAARQSLAILMDALAAKLPPKAGW